MQELPNGLLNVDKPKGVTSRDVVNRVLWLLRRRTGLRRIKVGHCGTLDPMAVGVLVIGVGPSTRLVTRVQQYRKTYRGSFVLGRTTTTDDVTGETTQEVAIDPDCFSECSIQELLAGFTGRISQVPPTFSAVHVNGRRAYELARKGREVEMTPRTVEIYSIELTKFSDGLPPEFDLKIECGSGTYIRSIGRDIGQRLGCGATMTGLLRTDIGPFRIQEAVPLGELDQDNIVEHLQAPAMAVCHLPLRMLDEEETLRILNGRDILRGHIQPAQLSSDSAAAAESVALMNTHGILVAIAVSGRVPGTLKPDTVFYRSLD